MQGSFVQLGVQGVDEDQRVHLLLQHLQLGQGERWQECCCFKVEILGAGSESEKARIRQMVRGKRNHDLCHFHFLPFSDKATKEKLSLSLFSEKIY